MEESHSDDLRDDSGGSEQLEASSVYGHRIGHLVAQKVLTDDRGTPQKVLFRCDCGRIVRISINKIRRGAFRDGCKRCWKPPKKRPGRPKKEVCQRTMPNEYATWSKIKKHARGLWRTSFEKFIKDMGPRPFKDAFLFRRDPKEQYYPSNCYWGVRGQDMMKKPLTYKGEPMTLAAAIRKFGFRRSFARRCREKGITTVEKMLSVWKDGGEMSETFNPIIGPEGFDLE